MTHDDLHRITRSPSHLQPLARHGPASHDEIQHVSISATRTRIIIIRVMINCDAGVTVADTGISSVIMISLMPGMDGRRIFTVNLSVNHDSDSGVVFKLSLISDDIMISGAAAARHRALNRAQAFPAATAIKTHDFHPPLRVISMLSVTRRRPGPRLPLH